MSQCYINGSYEHITNAQVSVEDRGFNFSDGVYGRQSNLSLKY